MDDYLFQLTDKTGRKIHLSNESRKIIRKKHPEVESYEKIEETLKYPTKITDYSIDESIRYYYRYYKHLPSPDKYLFVVVKYLNGTGFVVTAYFEDKIQ